MVTKQQKDINNILSMLKKIHAHNLPTPEIERLFLAILSPSEVETISQRLDILELLYQTIPQREISEKLGVGIATVTRGNRILKENIDIFKKLLHKI